MRVMKKRYIFLILLTVLLRVIIGIITFNNTAFAVENNPILKDGIYAVKASANQRYSLDITSGSKNNGANLELWTYAATNNQQFYFHHLGNGYYKISAVNSGKFLDVEGNKKTRGTNVLQWEYHGGDNQQWLVKDAGNGFYHLISKSTGLYLDINSSKYQNGTNITIWDKNNSGNQKFKLELIQTDLPTATKTIETGTYSIVTATDEKKVIDISGSSKQNGGSVLAWTNAQTANQKFQVKYLDNGYYSFTATHSSKLLDVDGAGKVSGTKVLQWESHGGNNQQWIIKDAGNGYYNIISRCNGLYMTVNSNGTISVNTASGGVNQKFKFVKPTANTNTGTTNTTQTINKTIADGKYVIVSATNDKSVLDVAAANKENNANVGLWLYGGWEHQKFNIKYDGNGYYTIAAAHSGKMIDIADNSKKAGANVQQYTSTSKDSQKWIIKDAGNGYYSIISKSSGLYLDVTGGSALNGTNIEVWSNENKAKSQRFKFIQDTKMQVTDTDANRKLYDPETIRQNKINSITVKHLSYTPHTSKYLTEYKGSIDEKKYPGYKEKLDAILKAHPNWKIQLLTIPKNFAEIINGERSVHGRNLVPKSTTGEYICSICGTKLYDTGWYCASAKAIAYYMDARNFITEQDIFQFLNVNIYTDGAYSLEDIKKEVKGTFLEGYENDIIAACKAQKVDPLFIIARLIQENGKSGSATSRGLYDSEYGINFYNPFNIGASGNGTSQVLANALKTAKSYGWSTMQRALEGGIEFCKANWLSNCQNTIYLNKFDIDDSNGTSLYNHQYMQNLMAAYSEGRSIRKMISDLGKTDSRFTFIIPVYENMNNIVSELPNSQVETSLQNVVLKAGKTCVRFRKEPNVNSEIIAEYNGGEKFLSLQRGINSDWQYLINKDGVAGYMSGQYLEQTEDVKICEYTRIIKTKDGAGTNLRIGPGTTFEVIDLVAENSQVKVIDDKTYITIDPNYQWFRVVLSNGTQGFIPKVYLVEK